MNSYLEPKRLHPPIPGEKYGCFDQGAPEIHSEYQLSRIYDILYAAEQAGLLYEECQKIFSALPESMKLEFNYSNWKYQSI